jgi:phosphogluconate dehydratase
LSEPRNAIHPVVAEVTERVRERSRETRAAYLERIRAATARGPRRPHLACSNLAHSFAAADEPDKATLRAGDRPSVAIVSAYNDMLSAHQPFVSFPGEIKLAVRAAGGVAQFAGGVPAMCDGVTQGETGMELSLFSRDVIAQATAVALSHDVFDAGLCLGVCDKIVPGLLIGALSFGHLPTVFVPAGPMTSGLPNGEKARVRQLYAEGKVGRAELLEAEAASYHSAGTCTFYGTARRVSRVGRPERHDRSLAVCARSSPAHSPHCGRDRLTHRRVRRTRGFALRRCRNSSLRGRRPDQRKKRAARRRACLTRL